MLSNELLGFIRRQVGSSSRPSFDSLCRPCLRLACALGVCLLSCSRHSDKQSNTLHSVTMLTRHAMSCCAVPCCALASYQFTGEDTNVSADSAGDDLYTWNVELWRTAFKPDCQLAKVSTGCWHSVAPQAAAVYHPSPLLPSGVASCTGMARRNDCQAHTLLAWPAMLINHSTRPPPVTHNTHPVRSDASFALTLYVSTHPQCCCCILQDLAEVSSKFAVSSVQLRFTFMRGLHPFYPPRVEVVRPHLSTPLPGALSSHPLLRLENWHPTLTMTQVVDNIRAFLEVCGGGAVDWVGLHDK